jgi:hypothetical protein
VQEDGDDAHAPYRLEGRTKGPEEQGGERDAEGEAALSRPL